MWVLADSSNGNFSLLDIYTQKKCDQVERWLGSRVVKELTNYFQGKWHKIYFDNFFTSKYLVCDLEEVGLYGIGTARTDRKHLPEQLKKNKVKKQVRI